MKTTILTLFICSFSIFSFGQQFEVLKDSMFKSGSSTQSEIICYNKVVNLTNDSLEMQWFRFEKNLPTGWKSQICDLNLCYWFDISTKTFKFASGDTANIDVHFWPEDIAGEGEIEVQLFIVGDSANTVHTSYYKAFANPVGISSVDEDIQIIVKPNPVKDVFSFSGLDKIEDATVQIFDLIGNNMELNIDLNSQYIDISNLPKGFYFLRVNSENHGFIKTVRIEKL